MDLYDQRDSKGQMFFSSFNQLPAKFPANSVAPSNGVWKNGDRIFAQILVQQHALTAIQQLQRYAIVFRNVLASNQHAVAKEATYISLICYENSLWTKKQPVAVWWEGRLGYRMPSKDSDRACNIRWLQQSLSGPGLYNRRLNVRQWIQCTIPRSASHIL